MFPLTRKSEDHLSSSQAMKPVIRRVRRSSSKASSSTEMKTRDQLELKEQQRPRHFFKVHLLLARASRSLMSNSKRETSRRIDQETRLRLTRSTRPRRRSRQPRSSKKLRRWSSAFLTETNPLTTLKVLTNEKLKENQMN